MAANLTARRTQPKRGQKIKIFKMIGKSLKKLAIGLAGRTKKSAGNGGGFCRCFCSPATVIPLEPTEVMKTTSARTITRTQPLKVNNKINNHKMIGRSIIKVPESVGKKRPAVKVQVSGFSDGRSCVVVR